MFRLLALCFVLALSAPRAQASPPQLDLRLSKGHGSRGYNSVRVSSINDDASTVKPDDFFAYAAPFQHRWTNFTLRTTVLNDLPSGSSPVATPLGSFTMRLPEQGGGIRGLIMGDPCFINGSFHPCTSGTRIARLLNAVAPSSDFRALLGDNLYDRDGYKTALMYSMLTQRAKETLQLAVPGNHDFWEEGEEMLLKEYDQFGNGFMQVYAQDVAASLLNASAPYDFSLNPNLRRVASGDNFFFYHSIGNMGWIGVSNHHPTSHAHLKAACAHMQSANVSLVFLLGHWCDVTLGAKDGYSTPQLYHKMLKMPGCSASVLRYVHGHLHENRVWARSPDSGQAVGYIVGGSGIDDQSRELGFGWMDSRFDHTPTAAANATRVQYVTSSRFNRELFAYFRLQRKASPHGKGKGKPAFDNFEEIVGCIEQRGVDACLGYAEIWSNATLPPPQV